VEKAIVSDNALVGIGKYLQQNWYTYKTKQSKTKFYVRVIGFHIDRYRISTAFRIEALRFHLATNSCTTLLFKDFQRLNNWSVVPEGDEVLLILNKSLTKEMLKSGH
jgi:hypothetical protein